MNLQFFPFSQGGRSEDKGGSRDYTVYPINTRSYISPGMLFGGLFTTSNLKSLFGNPDWYIKWLGIGTWESPLPSPPPAWSMIGDEYGDDCMVCLPSQMGRFVKQYPRTSMFWALILQ
jgi:hypothetical protein